MSKINWVEERRKPYTVYEDKDTKGSAEQDPDHLNKFRGGKYTLKYLTYILIVLQWTRGIFRNSQ